MIIGSDNGLSPGRRQAIIWTNAGILLIGPLGINFSEILFETNIFIQENAFENAVCKIVSILSQPQWINTHKHWQNQWSQLNGSIDNRKLWHLFIQTKPAGKRRICNERFVESDCHLKSL